MIKSIHFKAVAIWVIYTLITKGSLLVGISKSVPGLSAYVLNTFFSILFGCLFLYFFSHEDFFKFAKELEKKNSKNEKKWEQVFKHYSKITTSILIGLAAGPLVAALVVRFLLPKYKHKYLIIGLSSSLSAIFWLSVTRGVIRLPF